MSIPDSVTDTIRFFSLLFKSSEQEVHALVSEEIQDMQYSGKNVFTIDEVQEQFGNLESGLKQVFLKENEKVTKLVGSLCMQLMSQAQAQSCTVVPKPAELEDEKIIQMFKGGQKQQDNNMNKISDTTLLNNEIKIKEMEEEITKKSAEMQQLKAQAQLRVDQTPQFLNLKKMLQNKEARIEELEEELENKK
ncbi:Leucine_zipper-containing protein [Hexamita inflata]|uniref:Leucine zipper-containing protein n=1 Tax=Hexamita inflata TaxID=28002 RepID=A0AA86RJT1_9EUKA|nr:Leucine zipper-containing protein [Hexamita inflata]